MTFDPSYVIINNIMARDKDKDKKSKKGGSKKTPPKKSTKNSSMKKRKALGKKPKPPLVSGGNLVVIKPRIEKSANQKDFLAHALELLNDKGSGDIAGYAITVIYDEGYVSRILVPEDMADNLFSLYIQRIVEEYLPEGWEYDE